MRVPPPAPSPTRPPRPADIIVPPRKVVIVAMMPMPLEQKTRLESIQNELRRRGGLGGPKLALMRTPAAEQGSCKGERKTKFRILEKICESENETWSLIPPSS